MLYLNLSNGLLEVALFPFLHYIKSIIFNNCIHSRPYTKDGYFLCFNKSQKFNIILKQAWSYMYIFHSSNIMQKKRFQRSNIFQSCLKGEIHNFHIFISMDNPAAELFLSHKMN